MNNQTSSSIAPSQRTIISGKLKKPSRQLNSINLNPLSNKKTFLKQYSNAMQQKLQSLKQKISQKKKEKNKQESQILQKALPSNLQNFLKNKTVKKQQKIKKIITQKQIEQNLHAFDEFLAKNNLKMYKNLLLQHHIDSLDILAEATQKQLQQIGIPKGHSLKLKVNISKLKKNDLARQITKQKKLNQLREIRTKDSQRNISFVNQQKKSSHKQNQHELQNRKQQKLRAQLQSISIGTDHEDGLQKITFLSGTVRNKFCLFCYQSINNSKQQKNNQNKLPNNQFCSQICIQKYDQMFKKYQNNLIRAEQQFKKDDENNHNINEKDKFENKINKQEDEEDQNNWIDFLQNDDNQLNDFDFEQYDFLKNELQRE